LNFNIYYLIKKFNYNFKSNYEIRLIDFSSSHTIWEFLVFWSVFCPWSRESRCPIGNHSSPICGKAQLNASSSVEWSSSSWNHYLWKTDSSLKRYYTNHTPRRHHLYIGPWKSDIDCSHFRYKASNFLTSQMYILYQNMRLRMKNHLKVILFLFSTLSHMAKREYLKAGSQDKLNIILVSGIVVKYRTFIGYSFNLFPCF